MTFSSRFPSWTIGLGIMVLYVCFGHGAPFNNAPETVFVTDHGLFIIANSYPGNITVPVVDGSVMNELQAGHWGNWWAVNVTDHQAHIVNFRISEQDTQRVYADYNATVSGNAVVFISLGSSEVNDFYSSVRWT